jgi:hypothetical protein
MTPQERQLVSDLFDRLATLEASPRDPDAERLIADGFARSPNAAYALVQTALVQDEALKRADAKIRELSGAHQNPSAGGGFLDAMRNALGTQTDSGPTSYGRSATSVPSVRPAAAGGPDPRWNSGAAFAGAPGAGASGAAPQAAAPAYAPQPSSGSSFLGTAAATAAGAIGGALLFNSIGSLFGNHSNGSAFADVPQATSPLSSPWDNSAAGSDLSRDAGLNDVGGSGQNGFGGDNQSAGLFDAGNDDANFADNSDTFSDDTGGDFGGDFGGDDSV